MAKDKRSRSRKPSGKGSQSASRDPSPSPSSAPSPGSPKDQEGKLLADSKDDNGTLPQTAETSRDDSNTQGRSVSQGSEIPVLTDNGPLNSPQIEPALGAVVENPANNQAGGDLQSPTNTDQSLLGIPDDSSESSPTFRRPSFNLATELQDESMDSPEEDTQTEGVNESASRQEAPGADTRQQHTSENMVEAAGPEDVRSGRTEEEFQEEIRRRIAAEERVNKLETELKAQQQRYEEQTEADKRRFEHAIQKANQAREADKMKFDEQCNHRIDETVKHFKAELAKHMDNAAKLTAVVEAGEKSAADAAARIKRENDLEELRNAFQREVNPTVEGPQLAPRDYPRPGSARFLLAECEYLLDKSSPLYEAVRSAANYADGRGDKPSDRSKELLDAFDNKLGEMIGFVEEYWETPQGTLSEATRDWGYEAQKTTW
ncbi:hypothetical protein LA080_005638 [Diaporthe eres]|uniref:Uncharacterized protein n=1 Tax=Diaporthe vaccinii TaxID=105482 RepID=A0ABR4F160_9PEZI|nr:hypothetical protein LA080_005638 [Diaporthe eres]